MDTLRTKWYRAALPVLIIVGLLLLYLRIDPLDPRTVEAKTIHVILFFLVWMAAFSLLFILRKFDKYSGVVVFCVLFLASLVSVEILARLMPIYDSLDMNPAADHFWPDRFFPKNQLGLRDKELKENRDGKIRIIVLGDSFTEGAGVPKDRTFPSVLERLLNAKQGPTRYEVLNFGQRGSNTREEIELFKKVGRKLSPDIVILQYTDNDAETHPAKEREPTSKPYSISSTPAWLSTLQRISFSSRLGLRSYAAYLVYQMSPVLYPTGLTYRQVLELEHGEESVGWQHVIQGFQELAGMAAADGFTPVLVLVPSFRPGEEELRPIFEKVSLEGRKSGLVTLNLMDEFLKQGPLVDLAVSKWDGHPNAKAHEIIATSLYHLIQGIRDRRE